VPHHRPIASPCRAPTDEIGSRRKSKKLDTPDRGALGRAAVLLASAHNAYGEGGMTDDTTAAEDGPGQYSRRVPVADSQDLKRQLVDRVKATLRDEDMHTSVASGREITLPPIYIDADPTDDMEITIDPVIIDNNPTD